MKTGTSALVAAIVLAVPLAVSLPLLAASDTTSEAAVPKQGNGMAMMPMQQQLLHMQEQMQKIHAATNPAERREIMHEHASSMQGMMQMMHGMMAGQEMMGPGMMGPGMMGPGMAGPGMSQGHPGGSGMMTPGQMGSEGYGPGGGMGPGAMTPGASAMMNRLGMMEQRINLMQMMMDQMLKQQEFLLKDRNDGDS